MVEINCDPMNLNHFGNKNARILVGPPQPEIHRMMPRGKLPSTKRCKAYREGKREVNEINKQVQMTIG